MDMTASHGKGQLALLPDFNISELKEMKNYSALSNAQLVKLVEAQADELKELKKQITRLESQLGTTNDTNTDLRTMNRDLLNELN